MSYFAPFDLINGYKIQDQTLVGIDITRRNPSLNELREDETVYVDYTIRDGETAEILADRIYDTVDNFWVILWFNKIIDEAKDWPLDQYALEQYLDRTYGDVYAIDHYISASTGAIVDADHPLYDRVPVTILEKETKINDDKRNIKIPLPDILGTIKQLHREGG